MSSMRRLNRRLTRWHRFARKTYWNPRVSRPAWMGPNTAMPPGQTRAWNARELERERRQCFAFYPADPCGCADCALDDLDDLDDDNWPEDYFDDDTAVHIIDEHGFADRGLL